MLEALERLGLPDPVTAAISSFTKDLRAAAGENLVGLILYGGLARGKFRQGTSDVNLLVLLHSANIADLAAIAPVLGAAFRRDRADALVLTAGELSAAAEEFPVKFLDIRNAHVVLHGENPLAALEVSRDHIRHRLRQELRNLSLRLRRRYLLSADDAPALRRALAHTATPLGVQVSILLEMDGRPPASELCSVVFEAAAREYGLDPAVLSALNDLRFGKKPPEISGADLAKLFGGTLLTIDALLKRVAAEEVNP